MREHLSVGDDRAEFLRRYLLHWEERAGARAEQHLILDDVADAGEDRLVEQHVGDLAMRECPELFQRRSRVPSLRHDVGGEVVLGPYVSALYPFHRRRPDRDFTVRHVHHQPSRPGAPVIAGDGFSFYRRRERAPQHEVDAHGKRVEVENEMLPPGEDVLHPLAVKPLDAYPAIPADTCDFFPDERPELLGREMDGRTFTAFSLARFAPSRISVKLYLG